MSSQKEILNEILSVINQGNVRVSEGIPIKITTFSLNLSGFSGITITGKGKVILYLNGTMSSRGYANIDYPFSVDGVSIQNLTLNGTFYLEFEFAESVEVGTLSGYNDIGIGVVVLNY